MVHKIEIKEVRKAIVEVEADSREEAIEKAENDYWKDPNSYVLEPYDTFFQ